jgi:predicted metal-dependent enzyme (double-stranded beta helix superfamily)
MPRTAGTPGSAPADLHRIAPRVTTPHVTTPHVTTPSAITPSATDGPSPTEMLDFAHRTAADPDVVSRLRLRSHERTWISLNGPDGSEAWLIGWPPGAETGWHDHGGSRGAFATARGELDEQSIAVELPTEGWQSLELVEGVDRRRSLPTGRGRAFGPRHVHQVVNASQDQYAVSVHVYYPPLPLVRRYSRTEQVLRLRTVERREEW